MRSPEQFNNIIVANVGGYPVRIRDVGNAEIGPVDERVDLALQRQAVAQHRRDQAGGGQSARPVERGARRGRQDESTALPPGMKLVVAYDTSVFIDRSIKSVFETIAEAILLVVLVIFFFLRSLRATIIPIVTIPVSLIGAFGLMYAFGFTINTLTLLAIVLAIGLVVDDAIVMLENIFRHIEEGMPRTAGGHHGRARDRLRDRRDDAHARVGVRAAGVRHRPHRRACSSSSR